MKNNIANKTVPFRQRDEKKMSKYLKLNTITNVNSSKVIPYPKFRKRKKNSLKFYNNNKPLVIIAFLVLSICFISFINNKLLLNNSSADSSKPASLTNTSSANISTSDYKKYNEIISTDIRNTLSLSGNYEIKSKSMHKNGNLIFARGTISLPREEPVFFDTILQDNKISSLIVNGIEYKK
ncbi:MAG: hypothetical protein ACRDA3_04715 [Peptostreptococcaceae bacterium]